eukprot:31274-Pelagococcus_subviridis.AAC.2
MSIIRRATPSTHPIKHTRVTIAFARTCTSNPSSSHRNEPSSRRARTSSSGPTASKNVCGTMILFATPTKSTHDVDTTSASSLRSECTNFPAVNGNEPTCSAGSASAMGGISDASTIGFRGPGGR